MRDGRGGHTVPGANFITGGSDTAGDTGERGVSIRGGDAGTSGGGGPLAESPNDVERGWSAAEVGNAAAPVSIVSPDEFLFQRWYLWRNLPTTRKMRLTYLFHGSFIFTAYCLLFTLAVPIFTASEIVPYCAASLVAEATLVAYLGWQRRWSVERLSNAVALLSVLSAACVALGGFTHWSPSPVAMPVVAADGTTSTVYVRSETEFENDTPGPFIFGLNLLSATASSSVAMSGFPVTSRNAWTPFFAPIMWLVASAAYTFSANASMAHFLKVSLHQFAMLLQIAIYGSINVSTFDRKARNHFFTILGLRAEQLQCDRVLALMLPPTIMESLRAPVDDPLLDEGIPGSGDIRGVVSAGLGDERFADRFEDVSVMFAEGEEGKDMGIVNAAARSHLNLISHALI